MSKSVTLSFGEPEPPAAPPRPFNPASMTRDERTSAGWQTLFVGWVIGLPSIMAVAFVGLVGLWYAWQFTNDLQTWLALSAGLIAITLFSAGMPIAWSLNRETQPVAAKAAAAFGLACVAMNFGIMTHFATHKPELVQVERAPSEEVRQAIAEIAWRREDLADAEKHRDRWNEYTRTWYATTQAELRHFERIAGVPSSAPAGVPNHGLDLASVAILMIIGSAIGMAISAGSLAAILTEKAATVRLEAAPAPGPGSIIDVPSGHAGESADGFEAWARQCVSKLDGGKVRPAEAHASYLQFAARNDFARPLAIQEFGRRFNGYLANAYGIDGRHSNGTVFDGIALAPIGHALAVEGR